MSVVFVAESFEICLQYLLQTVLRSICSICCGKFQGLSVVFATESFEIQLKYLLWKVSRSVCIICCGKFRDLSSVSCRKFLDLSVVFVAENSEICPQDSLKIIWRQFDCEFRVCKVSSTSYQAEQLLCSADCNCNFNYLQVIYTQISRLIVLNLCGYGANVASSQFKGHIAWHGGRINDIIIVAEGREGGSVKK